MLRRGFVVSYMERGDKPSFLPFYVMAHTTFQNLTVRQYQQLFAIHSSKEESDIDKIMQSVCILADKTERQVEEMPLSEFNKVASELAVIFGRAPEGRPESFINIGGKRYGVNYKPDTFSAGQYIEIQTWIGQNVIENLHRIMASLVYPVVGRWPFRRRGKYNSDLHPVISEAILDCNFITVHSACVFFSELWKNSINSLEPYLAKEAMKKGITRSQLQTILQRTSDGFTTPKGSQISRM